MKKYFLFIIALFLAACSGASNNFVHVSMPNFKPQTPTKVEPIDSGVSIMLEPINIEQNNNYSDYRLNRQQARLPPAYPCIPVFSK